MTEDEVGLLILFLGICVELDHIRPARSRIGAFEIVLDGIGEYIGLSFAVFLAVLLRSDDDGLRAVHAVDAVNDLVEPTHLLDLLSIGVEEVLLDGTVGADAHHDDTRFFVLIALQEDSLEHVSSGLNNGGWCCLSG